MNVCIIAYKVSLAIFFCFAFLFSFRNLLMTIIIMEQRELLPIYQEQLQLGRILKLCPRTDHFPWALRQMSPHTLAE